MKFKFFNSWKNKNLLKKIDFIYNKNQDKYIDKYNDNKFNEDEFLTISNYEENKENKENKNENSKASVRQENN